MIDFNDSQTSQLLDAEKINNSLVDVDVIEADEEMVKKQYYELENLGTDLLKTIRDNDHKIEIVKDFIAYTNENYVSIVDYDQLIASHSKLIEIGDFLYKFIIIDCFNTIIPNYLEKIEAYNVEDFDLYFKNTLKNDSTKFKANFAKTINDIINKLLNLKKIDEKVSNDKNYKILLKRYGYYLELINFTDIDNFLQNYFRPVVAKNSSEINWRML